MEKYLFIGLGGFLGSVSRFWLSTVIHRAWGTAFPYGTLAVNIAGCFTIGLLITLFQEHFIQNPNIRLFLVIGVLGGFTTFSSFSLDTVELLKAGRMAAAGWNVLLSLAGCLTATWLGILAGERLA